MNCFLIRNLEAEQNRLTFIAFVIFELKLAYGELVTLIGGQRGNI